MRVAAFDGALCAARSSPVAVRLTTSETGLLTDIQLSSCALRLLQAVSPLYAVFLAVARQSGKSWRVQGRF